MKEIPIYWHGWRTNGETQMIQDFDIQPESLAPYDVLLASYEQESYSGQAFVLLCEKTTGNLYEVNGLHCSCNGLEYQWQPEQTTVAALRMRDWDDIWSRSMVTLLELVLNEYEQSPRSV